MENRAYALAAGLFMLIMGAALVAALWWFGGSQEDRKHYLLVSTGNVSGLNLEAQVRFRGIQAGKVESIGIDPQDPRNILVEISLRSDLPVTRGTRASLGYQGVTGLAYVQLEDLGEQPEPLSASAGLPRIALQPGLLDQASDAALDTLKRISALAERLGELLSDNNVKRVERTLDRLEHAAINVDRTFEQAPRTLAAVEQALGPEQLGRLPQVLRNLELAGQVATPAIQDFRQLVERLDHSAQNFDRFTDDAGRGLMTGTLPRLNALLELTETSRQVSTLFREVESAPQLLLLGRGRQAPGPGEAGFETPRALNLPEELPAR